jgi:RNA polymerase sigma-70 factor, ECF subfamily
MDNPDAPGLADAEARLELIFRRHYGSVLAYVERRARSEVVDDIVADTFLVAWRRLDDVPTNALPWLLGVARRTLATHYRASRRNAAVLAKLQALRPAGSAEPLDVGSSRAAATEALAMLSEKDREAVILVAWEELTPRDAAAVIGESAVTFRVRLHRAKRRLRSEIARRTGAEADTTGKRLAHEQSQPVGGNR